MKKNFWFLAILFCGVIIRVLYLSQHDFWFDESFSYFISILPLQDLLTATAADNNPPFYYILLHLWMQVFGDSETALRILSLILGIVSIPVFYILCRKMYSEKIPLLATFVFSLNPLMVYYSSETRMYSLFVLLTLLIVIFFLEFLKRPVFKNALSFLLSLVISFYTHYYSLLLLLPLSYLVLRQKKKFRIQISILIIISLLLYIPWILKYVIFNHPSVFATPTVIALPATIVSFILGATGVVSLRTYFSHLLNPFIKLLFFVPASMFLFYGASGIIQSLRTRRGKMILTLFAIPLGFLTVSNLFIPVFSVRSAIFLAPFFYMLIGLGMQQLPNNKQSVSIIVSIILFLLVHIIHLTNPLLKGPQIKQAISKSPTGKPILHTSVLTYYPYRYYLKDRNNNTLLTTNPLTDSTVSIIGGKKHKNYTYKQMILVDIAYGSDPKEKNEVIQELKRFYQAEGVTSHGTITITDYVRK